MSRRGDRRRSRRKQGASPLGSPPPTSGGHPVQETFERWIAAIFAPQPIVRLEVIRIVAPLAILGFMAMRMAHPEDWLADSGFRIPDLGGDWRQPVSVPAVAPWMAYAICAALVMAGLATASGFATRIASAVFAGLLVYVALADRLSAFTVSKLAPMIALALCLSPSGTRYSIAAWLARRRDPTAPVIDLVSGGCVRFFQFLLPVFYMSSGICKARGDWLDTPYVLWTHVHDSYQTSISWWLANNLPVAMWPVLQGITLVFEIGAPLWFSNRFTRPYALAWGIAMHAMIGLMFGPVIWFSLLMIVLLVASYAPVRWLERPFRRLAA
jgi:uncharacterized membrane protein YphA (DoxX/SURF4 family)